MDFYNCKCGLSIEEVLFVDDVCIICYEKDASKISHCKDCGKADELEYFTNRLCEECFIKELSE